MTICNPPPVNQLPPAVINLLALHGLTVTRGFIHYHPHTVGYRIMAAGVDRRFQRSNRFSPYHWIGVRKLDTVSDAQTAIEQWEWERA